MDQADFFISHASEDKAEVARPLAESLHAHGYEVWYDEYTLKLGESIREEIDRGLKSSRYAIVILSPAFFNKKWPTKELDALVTLEASGIDTRVLPVWHNVTAEDVTRGWTLVCSCATREAASATRIRSSAGRIAAVHNRGVAAASPAKSMFRDRYGSKVHTRAGGRRARATFVDLCGA
jgi:hypothetical protein